MVLFFILTRMRPKDEASELKRTKSQRRDTGTASVFFPPTWEDSPPPSKPFQNYFSRDIYPTTPSPPPHPRSATRVLPPPLHGTTYQVKFPFIDRAKMFFFLRVREEKKKNGEENAIEKKTEKGLQKTSFYAAVRKNKLRSKFCQSIHK